MTGLDTNVLVRYFTQDDATQARKADAAIGAAAGRGEHCFVGVITLCELVWVLRGAYGYDRETVALVLEKMLATAQLVVEEKDTVRLALRDFRAGPGDFADYLTGRRNQRAGCARTATFDRALRGSELFAVL